MTTKQADSRDASEVSDEVFEGSTKFWVDEKNVSQILCASRLVWILSLPAWGSVLILLRGVYGSSDHDCLCILAILMSVALGANTLLCVRAAMSSKAELARFLTTFRASASLCGTVMAAWEGNADSTLFVCLCMIPQLHHAASSVSSLLGQGERGESTLFVVSMDALPFLALSIRLRAMGSSMGSAGVLMTVLTGSVASRLLQTGVSTDLAAARSLFAEALDRGHQTHLKLQLAHARLAEERLAMARMLAALCDCRLQISRLLDIMDPSPQLGDLLGRADAGALYGVGLGSFLSADDARRLRDSVAREVYCGEDLPRGPASCLQVDLLPVVARPIPIELYHARLSGSELAVAIRRQTWAEDFPAEDWRPPDDGDSDGDGGEGHLGLGREARGLRLAERGGRRDQDAAVVEHAWVQFDAMLPGNEIIRCSPPLQDLASTPLNDLLPVAAWRDAFDDWVRREVDAYDIAVRDGTQHAPSDMQQFELHLPCALVRAAAACLEVHPTTTTCVDGIDLLTNPVTLHLRRVVVTASGEDVVHDSVSEAGDKFVLRPAAPQRLPGSESAAAIVTASQAAERALRRRAAERASGTSSSRSACEGILEEGLPEEGLPEESLPECSRDRHGAKPSGGASPEAARGGASLGFLELQECLREHPGGGSPGGGPPLTTACHCTACGAVGAARP